MVQKPTPSVSVDQFTFRRSLFALALVACVMRLVVAFALGLKWNTPDTLEYLDMASRILEQSPRSYFPNGYPLVIAVVQWLVGADALVIALRIMNVFASTAVVVVIGLLGRKIGGERIGLLAALGTAFYPNQINLARYVLTEPLTTLFLISGILLFVQKKFTSSAISIYATSLFRSTYGPVLLILAALLLLFKEPKKYLMRLGLGAALAASAYGALVLGDVVQPTNNLDVNYLFAVRSLSHQGVDWEIRKEFTPEEMEHASRLYVTFALNHPREFILQRVSSLWTLWGPLAPLGDGEQRRSLASALLIGLRFPLLLMAALGVWFHRKEQEIWVVATPIIVITTVHTMFFSYHRHIVPVEPLLLLLATTGIVGLFAAYKKRHSRTTATMAAV